MNMTVNFVNSNIQIWLDPDSTGLYNYSQNNEYNIEQADLALLTSTHGYIHVKSIIITLSGIVAHFAG